MNVRFMHEISDAYRLDRQLDKSTQEIFGEFYEAIKETRLVDPGLYNYLCEISPIEQQKIFKWYMDSYYSEETGDDEVINEVIMTILRILDPWLSSLRGWWTKQAARIATHIERAAETFSKESKYTIMRHSIIKKNFQECYQTCEVNIEDLPSHIYGTVRGKHYAEKGTGYVPFSAMTKGICLFECYIKKVISIIGMLSETYFDCLKASGELEQYQTAEADDILAIIRSTKVGAACQEYQKKLDEMIDDFKTLLDFGYTEDEQDKRQDKYRELRKVILQARDKSGDRNRRFQSENRRDQRRERRY